jgi:hypothetical protein
MPAGRPRKDQPKVARLCANCRNRRLWPACESCYYHVNGKGVRDKPKFKPRSLRDENRENQAA